MSTEPELRPIHVSALGATIAIEAGEDRLRRRVLDAWSACLTKPLPGCPVVRAPIPANDSTEGEVAQSMQTLTQSVTYAAIRARAGQLLMFHAGGLSNQTTGATIAFVAPGGTGKTTLVRTLGPGRGYVSDETVGVAPDGSIEPYCKPLSVRRHDPGEPKDEISPLSLDLEVPKVTPWLAGMVLLRRDNPAGHEISVEEVHPLDALVKLGPETSSLAAHHRPLHALSALLASIGGLRVVHYHDASQLQPVVREVLARPRQGPIPVRTDSRQ